MVKDVVATDVYPWFNSVTFEPDSRRVRREDQIFQRLCSGVEEALLGRNDDLDRWKNEVTSAFERADDRNASTTATRMQRQRSMW